MKKILEVNNLKVSFPNNVEIIGGVSFSIYEKQIVAIIGESGCGKTTLALAIARLLSPLAKYDCGEVLIEGNDFLKMDKKAKRAIYKSYLSVIFQDPQTSLNPIMKIGKQIEEALEDKSYENIINLITSVGIENAKLCYRQYPHEISGGMRQRVMIAIALAKNPKLIIADEPTASIDPIKKTMIIDLFKEIQNKYGSGILLITHDIDIADKLADEIIVMYGGKIMERLKKLAVAKHPYTVLLLSCAPSVNKGKLGTIKGAASYSSIGCPFANRCPAYIEICRNESPPLFIVDDNEVACWLYKDKSKIKTLHKLLKYAEDKKSDEIFSQS
jgi:peptide/nickel transport system ATP-binding protein